jgi:RNase H-fold protein (predicted Holliday junction resolvase)
MGIIASPAGFIARRRGKRPPIAEMIRRGADLAVEGFVVGLPLDQNGDDTPRALEARHVAAELEKRTGLPVRLVDERYTTAAGAARRTRDGRLDTRPQGRRRCHCRYRAAPTCALASTLGSAPSCARARRAGVGHGLHVVEREDRSRDGCPRCSFGRHSIPSRARVSSRHPSCSGSTPSARGRDRELKAGTYVFQPGNIVERCP